MRMSYRFGVPSDHDGRRIDRVVKAFWPDLPIGAMMKAFRKGGVRVDGKKASPSTRVFSGQEIWVEWEPSPVLEERAKRAPLSPAEKALLLGKAGLSFVYRDEHVWILNKPAGLLVQPDVPEGDSLITRVQKVLGKRAGFQPSTPHRLDRNTSGLVLVALDGPSLRSLNEAIRKRSVKKLYWALVVGKAPDQGCIEVPLLKDPLRNRVVVSQQGKPSLTLFRTLKRGRFLSLIEVDLVTGRPHQIRVHLAHIGLPILGDAKYGEGKANRLYLERGGSRPLLHARSLLMGELPSPLEALSGKAFEAPVPSDFENILNEMA